MQKQFFTYRFGFVNLEGDRLYLTHTGNWSEVRTLAAKGELMPATSAWRRFRMVLFVFLVAIALLLFGVMRGNATGAWVGGLASSVVLIWLVFNGMRTEMGRSFFLTRQRIIGLYYQDNGATMAYRNLLDGEATYFFPGMKCRTLSVYSSGTNKRRSASP